MQFDPENKVIQLCIEGMENEGAGKPEEAEKLFLQAWNESENDFEKFTSAHYVARHQSSITEKLKWDEIALVAALNIKDESIKGSLPSLYLNIGKCYEDLKDYGLAIKNYKEALFYTNFLPANEYGNMIKNGIEKGLARISDLKW